MAQLNKKYQKEIEDAEFVRPTVGGIPYDKRNTKSISQLKAIIHKHDRQREGRNNSPLPPMKYKTHGLQAQKTADGRLDSSRSSADRYRSPLRAGRGIDKNIISNAYGANSLASESGSALVTMSRQRRLNDQNKTS